MKKIVPVDKILEEKDDFELCDGIDSAICAGYGDKVMLPEAPIEMQTVALTWYVTGIFGFNGLESVFWRDFPNDEAYERIAGAFHRIGCEGAAAAIERTVAKFPGGRVPHNNKERQSIFMSIPEDVRKTLDDDFGSDYREIEARLAAYIRSNRSVFVHLPPAIIVCADEDARSEPSGENP